MSTLDERIAGEIDQLVDAAFDGYTFWSYVQVRDANDAGWAGAIPIIGTIDSETGAITHSAPLPEPPAPLTAENYAAGRMPFWAWLIGALGIGVAVAIAAVMVLVDRVRKAGAK